MIMYLIFSCTSGPAEGHLILETKGYDPWAMSKRSCGAGWAAVNTEGQFGRWRDAVAHKSEEIRWHIEETVARMRKKETAAAEIT